MIARILPLTVLVPVLLAGWLTSQGGAKLHAVSEEEVVSYSQLLKQAEEEAGAASTEVASAEGASAEDASAQDEGSETVLVATNE